MGTTKRFTSAVIVAAGNSLRMKCEGNKNYLCIGEYPSLSLTLHAFDSCKLIDEIVLVYKKGEASMARTAAEDAAVKKKISYTEGGETRSDSVFKGLKAVNPICTHVAIHDGARSLITPEDITEVLLCCYECGAATAAARVTDTLCEIKPKKNGMFISHYINRDDAALIQTPQCFEYDLIKTAHKKAEHGSKPTDDTSPVLEIGREVRLVFTKSKNLKITEPEDLYVAKGVIEHRKSSLRGETEGNYADE